VSEYGRIVFLIALCVGRRSGPGLGARLRFIDVDIVQGDTVF
jgi:hypothetical protein